MSVGLSVAVLGQQAIRRELERYERKLHDKNLRVVKTGVRQVQIAIRRDVSRIFKKNRRAANAVRSVVYDNGRGRGAAGLIFSKFGKKSGGQFVDFLGPYLTGRAIVPRNAKNLAVPLQKGKRNRDPSRFKAGELQQISVAGQLYLIKQTRTRTTFMFLLIPKVTIRRRIRPNTHIKRISRVLPRMLQNQMRGAR